MPQVVRCFPHCFPAHRPRSYCGTSLYVQVSTTAGTDLTDNIEEDDENPSPRALRIGERIPSTEITATPVAGSIWVKGERDVSDDERQPGTNVFVLRGSADEFHHWESDWKSGTSQQQRLTPHHFRVYVFAPSQLDPLEWHVVGVATSPPFAFLVYRKHQHDPEVLRLKEIQSTELEEDANSERKAEGDEELKDDDGTGTAVSSEMLRDLVWHRQHRSAAANTTNIAILVQLAFDADSRWLAAHSRSLFTLLLAATTTNVAGHLLLHYVNHCVPQLISLLPQHRETTGSKGERLMETLAELLCFILNPERTGPVLAFVAAHACRPLVTAETNRDLLLQWIDMVAEHVEDFFQQRGTSTESFVDDIVSIAMREGTDTAQHAMAEMLRNTRVMGQRHFFALLAKLRLQAAQADEHQHQGKKPFTGDTRKWTGRWLCRGFRRDLSTAFPTRRSSWPQVATMRPWRDASITGAWSVGTMSAMAVILSGVGFELSVCGDEGTSLCIEPLITVLDKSHLHFPLDDVFVDVTNLLPLEWAALLAIGSFHKRVFGRARALHDDDGEADGKVELEFLVHDPDVDCLTTWRCQLRFETPSTWASHTLPAAVPRRRLIVHVRVDEAQSSEPQHVQDADMGGDRHSEDSENEEEDGWQLQSDSSGSSTKSDLPSRQRSPRNEHGGGDPLRLYTRVQHWHTRIAFQSTCYALD